LYESYFGLTERPFSIAPDPDYLYMSSRHKEAMAHLSYGLSQGGCFIVLTGEVGTGKTTLCRNLLTDLPDNVDVALILNANLGSTELLQTVCDELKVGYEDEASQKQLLDRINAHLLKTFAENRHTVLIIDEAQLLKRNVLEQVRMLTNLETTKSKLLQIILIGQPELYDMLSRNDLRQLAQRVTARYHLGPLERSDIDDYVNYRLNVAGCKQPLFSRQALNKLYALTSGIPRKINVLADHALLATYSQHKTLVDAKTVAKSAKEVFIVTKSRDPKKKSSSSSRSSRSSQLSRTKPSSSRSSGSSSISRESKRSRSGLGVSKASRSTSTRKSSSGVSKSSRSSKSSLSTSAGKVSKSSRSTSASKVSKSSRSTSRGKVGKSSRLISASKPSRKTSKPSRSTSASRASKLRSSSTSTHRRRRMLEVSPPKEPFFSSLRLPEFNWPTPFPWHMVMVACVFLGLVVVAWWTVGYFSSDDQSVVEEVQAQPKELSPEPYQQQVQENEEFQSVLSEAEVKPGKAIISDTFLTADDEPVDVAEFNVDAQPLGGSSAFASEDTPLGKKLEASGDVTGRITALRNLALEWQVELPSKLLSSACKSVVAAGLKCLEVKQWEKVESFNRPAVVLLKHNEQVHRVIVKSLAGGEAAVVIGSSIKVVPVEELKQRWAGSGLIYWRPSLGGTPILKKGDQSEIIKDIRLQLSEVLSSAKLSPLQELTSSKFDDDLSEKVKLLQQSFSLEDDGLIGSETYLAMNEVINADSTPVLRQRTQSVLN